MFRITVIIAVASLVALAAIVALAAPVNKLQMHHRRLPFEAMKLKAATRMMEIHRNLMARGLQPKGAKLYDHDRASLKAHAAAAGNNNNNGGAAAAKPQQPRLLSSVKAPSSGMWPAYDQMAYGGYEAEVHVGTPPQKFRVIADTGSSTFWIASSSCTDYKISPACKYMKKFSNASSSTWNPKCGLSGGCSTILPYGSGTAIITVGKDTLRDWAGFTLTDLHIGLADVLPGAADDWRFTDGILGLCSREIALPFLMSTPFDVLRERKMIKEPILSVFLSNKVNKSDSEIVFGARTDRIAGPWLQVQSPLVDALFGYYAAAITGIKVGKDSIPGANGQIGVLDTGTSLLALPPNLANPILAKTNVTANCSNLRGLPDITITLQLPGGKGDHDFVLTPEQYTYQLTFKDGSARQCQAGVMSFDAGMGVIPLSILGDPFLRTYAMTVDRGNGEYFLAKSKQD